MSVIFLGTSCCRTISIIENINYTDVLKLSRESGKPVFLIVGGGDNCIPCHIIKKQLRKSDLLRRFKDDFIFYLCNVNKSENNFIYEILLPRTIPNYYILDPSGDIVAFSFAPLDDERILYELTSYLNGNPKYYETHSGFYSLSTDSLLKMQNLLITANLLLYEKEYGKSLELVEKSIAIYPYFYNNYLKYKINLYLGKTADADSLGHIALQYNRNTDNQSVIYEKYIKELQAREPQKEVDSDKPYIQLINPIIKCGTLRFGSDYTYEFKFINKGKDPLILLNVSYSCGCTMPRWQRIPVKQNDTGTVYVKFNAESYGNFSRSLTLHSNASNSMENIILQGIIK